MASAGVAAGGSGSGVGLTTILGVVFIVLKLTHVVSWSWPVVLIPFFVSAFFAFVAIILMIVFFVFAYKETRRG